VQPDWDILDVAAGPGTLVLEAASRVRAATALDFSEPMLDELRARSADIRAIRVVHGDGQALPFADGAFDAAFSMFGLMFFPDRGKGFVEMLRVLRPGGVAVVSSWAPVSRSPLMRLMFGALRAADPSRPEPSEKPLSLENPEVLTKEMTVAGFSEVVVEAHEARLAVASADELWHKMSRSSAPLVMLQKKLGAESWARQSDAARAYLASELQDTPTTLGTTAWLAVGRKP
jgi:SAM-dependent methyltransferase